MDGLHEDEEQKGCGGGIENGKPERVDEEKKMEVDGNRRDTEVGWKQMICTKGRRREQW